MRLDGGRGGRGEREDSQGARCAEWLKAWLGDDTIGAQLCYEEGARQGYHHEVVRKASVRLGVEVMRRGQRVVWKLRS